MRGGEASREGEELDVIGLRLLEHRRVHGDAKGATGFIAGEQACGDGGGGALIVMGEKIAVNVRGLGEAGEEHEQDGSEGDDAGPSRMGWCGPRGLEAWLQGLVKDGW